MYSHQLHKKETSSFWPWPLIHCHLPGLCNASALPLTTLVLHKNRPGPGSLGTLVFLLVELNVVETSLAHMLRWFASKLLHGHHAFLCDMLQECKSRGTNVTSRLVPVPMTLFRLEDMAWMYIYMVPTGGLMTDKFMTCSHFGVKCQVMVTAVWWYTC